MSAKVAQTFRCVHNFGYKNSALMVLL